MITCQRCFYAHPSRTSESKKEGFNLTQQSKASIDHPNIYHCGDVMYDNSMHFAGLSDDKSTILEGLNISNSNYILCTIHRDSNTDDAKNLNSIFRALLYIQLSSHWSIILPLHPRTRKKWMNCFTLT